MINTEHIRTLFLDIYKDWLNKTYVLETNSLEIINCSFLANEEVIFGEINKEYIKKELDWYLSKSLNINDLAEPIPKIWKEISGKYGEINSNYGWCIFSHENYNQFQNAIDKLLDNKHTRQSVMIYNRPNMHKDATRWGMNDFICTYAAQLFIRNNILYYLVYMRSNDAIYGYKNDRYWHNLVFDMSLDVLKSRYPNLKKGDLFWNVGSLHIYPRHFYILEKELKHVKNR